MIKSENRKVKGSVLLTVVAVMSILIVFLFGTLALALAANNRAHVNYSSAQTSITARTIAESVVETANSNTTQEGNMFANVIGEIDADNPGPVPVAVSINGNGTNSLGIVESVEVSYAGKKSYYDVDKEQWEVRDLLKITATVEMSGVTSQASVYALKYKIGDKDSTATGGAGFVTTNTASVKCQSNIFGGAYVNLPQKDVVDYTDGVPTPLFEAPTLDSNSFALVNSGNSVIEADLFVYNNLYVQNWDRFVFPSIGKGITVMGDMYFSTSAVELKDGKPALDYYYSGDYPTGDIPFNQVPYIYVQGKIYTENGKVAIGELCKDGDSTKPVPLNTFCGTFDNSQGGNGNSTEVRLATNLYCMDAGAKSHIRGIKQTSLENWVKSVITKSPDSTTQSLVKGEVCSNGDLTLEECTIDGNVRVAGDLTIIGNVTVNGYIACDGKVIKGQNGNLSASTIIYNDNAKVEGGEAEDEDGIELPNHRVYYYFTTPEYDAIRNAYVEPVLYPKADNSGFETEKRILKDGYYFNENGQIKEDMNINDVKLVYTLNANHQALKNNGTDAILTAKDNIDFVGGVTFGKDLSKEIYDNLISDSIGEAEDSVYYLNIATSAKKGTKTGDETARVVDGYNYIYTKNADGSYANEYKVEKDGEVYSFDFDYTHILKKEENTFKAPKNTPVGSPVKKIEGFDNTVKSIEEFKAVENENFVYPEYARRSVISGKADLTGATVAGEGKVIQTVQEILDMAKPYEQQKMSDDIKKLYNSSNEVTDLTIFKTIEFDRSDFSIKHGSTTPNAIYIDKSCKINDSVANGDTNNIVIDPKDGQLVIGIQKLELAADIFIYIDDSKGGNVYFYIEDGGTFDIQKGSLLTKTYWEKIGIENNPEGAYVAVKSGTPADYKDITTETPRAYVYAGNNATLKLGSSGGGDYTVNIISTNINFSIATSGTYSNIQTCLYDGYPIATNKKPTIIGCCNVKEANLPNEFSHIHIPSDGEEPPDPGQIDRDYWYSTHYYTEF